MEVALPMPRKRFLSFQKKIRGGNSKCVVYPALKKFDLDSSFPFFFLPHDQESRLDSRWAVKGGKRPQRGRAREEDILKE